MLYIKDLEDNTIQLNESEESEYSFNVVSENNNGSSSPFVVKFISSENISSRIEYGNILNLYIENAMILNEEYIFLRNTVGDTIRIAVIPSPYHTMEKTYSFKITSSKYLEDGSLKLKISSKMNGEDMGWKCTYDGKPMAYSITPFESEISEHVIIKPLADVRNEFKALVEFTQNKSNNVIKILLTNTPSKGITNYEKKVD